MVKYLTQESLEKFKKELDYLENVKRKEIAELLKNAISFGDLSENAAYTEAKEAQSFLEGRILELRKIVLQAELVDKKENGGKVQIGSAVFISSKNGKGKFQIVEPEEADVTNGKISYLSPLGKSLLGKVKGDELKVETPEGEIKYKIINII